MLNQLQWLLVVTSVLSVVSLPAIAVKAEDVNSPGAGASESPVAPAAAINEAVVALDPSPTLVEAVNSTELEALESPVISVEAVSSAASLTTDSPATTVEEWMTQIAQSQVTITGVQVEETAAGLQIVVETTGGDLTAPATQAVGDALVVEIPNAVLDLPEGAAFEQFAPAEGIALVSVTQLPDDRVQISITGTDAPPQAEVSAATGNLVLSVVPGVATATETDEEAIEVVVTATRTEEDILDVPRSVTVITREEFERQSRVTPNFYDTLGTLVPGLGPPNQSDRVNAQTLRGRGSLTLIDGVPVESNILGGNGLRGLDPNIIERVEVVRGPTGLYGSGATGGVINIITRRSEEASTGWAEVGISADLGELEDDSFAYELGFGGSGTEGRLDYVLNFSAQFTNQFYDAEGDVIPQSFPTLAESTVLSGFGRLGFNLTDEQRIQLSVNHINDRRDVENFTDPAIQDIPGRQKARAMDVGLDFDDIERPGSGLTNVDLTYTHNNLWGSRLQAQAYYYNSDVRGAPDDLRGDAVLDSVASGEFASEAYGGRLQIETSIAQSLELLWGADYRDERNERTFDILDPVAFDQGVARFVERRTQVPPYFIDQLGLFAQLQWDLSPSFTLSGGIRQEFLGLSVDDYTNLAGDDFEGGEADFDATVFNVGGVYRATDNLSIFASFSQGFSAPSFFVLAFPPPGFSVDEGFEGLEPQTVDNYEIGLRGRWGNVQASLAGFYSYSELGTFLRARPGSEVAASVVRAPQRNYGIEAALDWQPAEQWRLGGTVTWNEGESDPGDDGEFVALGTFSVQPWKLTAYVENQTTPTWNNRLQLLYSGNRDRAFDDGIEAFPIEDYITFDWISQLQLGQGTLSLAVENLLDTQYFPVFAQVLSGFNDANYRAARGRRVSLSYSISF
ncbi:MAG: TonB-dependent receptor [Cyanobacteria bacterium J06626_4]